MAKRCEPARRPRISMVQEQAALSTFYKLGETLGTGGFGKVKLAVHTLTGQTVAIKIMDKVALGEEFGRAEMEIALLRDMRHPRICELYQVIDTPEKLYLVMEHCVNGELFEYLMQNDRLPEKDARAFFRQVVSAVAFLHNNGCAHRDLKPENILLDGEHGVKLIDFGLAARPRGGLETLLDTCCGSPAYVAPELIIGDPYNGAEADIWSLGVLLYALVVGSLPFQDDDTNKLFRKIQAGLFHLPAWITPDCKNLLKDMLRVNPLQRIKMSALVAHRWVMKDIGVPVRVNFCDDLQVDGEIIERMVPVAPYRHAEMIASVKERRYDYWHATYLILKSRQRHKKILHILPAGIPFSNASHSQFCSPAFRSPPSRSPVKTSVPSHESSTRLSDISFDVDEGDSDADTVSAASTSAESVTENVKPPLREPNTVRKTQAMCKKDEATKSWEVDLDRSVEPLQEITRQSRGKSQSMEEGLENANFVSPKKRTTAEKRMPPPSTLRNKFMGSLEKLTGRVKEALTPGRGSPLSRRLRELKRDEMAGTTSVASTDPEVVLQAVREALLQSGWEMKMKRGYVIRAKKLGPRGELLSKVALEICWVVSPSGGEGQCVIFRKRLEGDFFNFRKHYAELIYEIQKRTHSAASDAGDSSKNLEVAPTRLAFDC
ncbi:Maternal embryonic leucine zipper kinase [Hypsibius exemplaris]|uniref:non-specific serine/threonine protein kinase n=1 Tax=Hypsibius exemplaris TaxID=2072580 RepID=A0A9X6NDJ9_HYPEX|nr:Maternal embryonic leucine zipper kinase [Hypsibius exemplaris]